MAAITNVQQMTGRENLIYDAQGNLIGIQNPRGGGNDLLPSLLVGGKIVAKGRVSQIGHSFQSNGWVGSQLTSLNSLAWAAALLGSPLDITANYGVSGATIAGVISGQLASILADTSTIAHVDIGINDVADNSATSADITSWATQVQTLAAALCGAKQAVIWCGIDPASTTFAPRAADARNYNAVTANILAQYQNAVFVPMDTALKDPAASPFAQTLLASVTFDSLVHPNTAGAYRRGYAIAAAIRDRIRLTDGYSVTRSVSLPAFGTSGGTATPGSGVITQTNPIPNGYTVLLGGGSANLTVVVTTSNPTSGPKRVRLSITATGAGAGNFSNTSAAAFAGAINTGETMRATAQVALVSNSGALTELSTLLNRNSQLVSANSLTAAIETPTIGWPTEAHLGTWRTKPTVATGNSNSCTLTVTFRFGGAGTAVIDIYEGMKLEAVSEV